MSDIIKDAKKLLELVDEERAGLESRGAEPNEYGGFEMWLDATVLYGNAKEVRESIKELAEETWEYGVEYKYLTNRGAEWRLDPDVGWHKTYRDAERAASASVRYRIVRRRVSPVEVINE